MTPEPLPWDRKDFVFKDRKNDRISAGDALASAAFVGGNNNPRLREPCNFFRASPRRPPPRYHRQNGSYYQLVDESNGHGCTPSRSDDASRSSNGRYNGGRSSSREDRGSVRRSPYYDCCLPSHVTSQRSVADPITSPSTPPPPLKDVVDKISGGADGLRSDRDGDHSLGSIGWKPLKWGRQGSISTSGTVRSEVQEAGNGLLDVSVSNLGKETPARSTASSPVAIDDGLPKKKPRLTWGQGLAKYEKQKVEGSSNSGKEQVSESSPKVMEMAGWMSPVTPCSAVCSSPGTADRPFSKATNIDNDSCHHKESSDLGIQNGSEDLPSKLDQLSTLSTLLTDLFQPEDACSGDSTSTRTTATNKLLLFKAGITKELEKTECEIDLLETELKSFNNDGESNHSQYSMASQTDSLSVHLLESADVSSKVALNLTPAISSATTAAGESVMPVCPSGEHGSELRLNTEIQQTAFTNGKSTSSDNEEPMSLDFVEHVVAGNVSEVSNHLYGGNSGATTGSDMSSHENTDGNFISLIMSSNKDAAKRASHILDGASPTAQPQLDIWGSDRLLTCRKNDIHVRETLSLLKHRIKFKERVLTLKFRAFHHLWKEDLRLLSVRKQRPKSQKRLDLCSHSSQSSSQKQRSSIHSRFTLPAGNLTIVPTSDIVDFTSRLLSDSQFKLCRKNLKMPAFILDEMERRCSRFIAKNNLVEDPPSFEKERSMINPWTNEEKGVFMEMLATFGKDFTKISSFLSHKTTADCIEFYYKNHKSESFRDVKKQLDQRKQWRCLSTSTYMVTSGKKWNREANAASLDMLGSLSVAVAHINDTSRYQQKYAARSVVSSFHNLKASRGSCSSLERISSIELSGYEKEPAGTDALAGVYGALSSEAVSSCVTSSLSPLEKMNCLRMDMPLTPEVTQTIEEEDICSDEGCGELISVDWIDEEKSMFIRALSMYGKDFSRISECVGTKSRDQCKIFFSKARKCLSLDQIQPVAGIGGTPMSDANGGRSDTDDACVAEMNSAICSTQSCSRMDVDSTQSVANAGDEVFAYVGDAPLRPETDRSIEYEGEACNQEEVDGRVDGHGSVLKVEKFEIEPENVQFKCVEGTDAAAYKNSDGVLPHDDAVSTGNVELGTVYNGILHSSVESAAASCVEGEQLKPHITAEVQLGGGIEAKSAAANMKRGVEFQQVQLVSNAGSGESQRKIDMHDNSVKFSLAVESTAKENDFFTSQEFDASCSRAFNFSTHQHMMPVDMLSCSQKRSQVSSKKQDGVYYVPLSTVFPDPSSISSEGSFRVPFQSTLNFNEYLHKLQKGSSTKDLYPQCLSRNNLNQIDQSSHVISGHPLPVRNQNMICEKPVLRESHSEGNLSSQSNRFFVRDIPNENGEDSVASSPRPAMFFFQRNEDTSESQLRSCSTSACRETEEQSTLRTGDVKLFGQILSNLSSKQQKSNFSSQEADGHCLSPEQKKPASTKMSSRTKDGKSLVFPSKLEGSGQSNLEEVPLRSYGYWDGNRIQTGFSSLPDSAIMLAAYQGPVAGTPFFPAKDSDVPANGLATNFQHSYIRPRSANGMRLDSFQDLQKRSGFELVSGFQQGGRTAMARLGVNMAGGSRGILVGGAGVSDPVAALRMAKLYARDAESWTRDLNGG